MSTSKAPKGAKLKLHPICELIPTMSAEDRARLKAGIERDGRIHVPIIVLGNEILDGRNRWEISQELRIECPMTKYRGKTDMASLAAYVMALNVDRRHMTVSQLAMTGASLTRIIETGRADGQDTNVGVNAANLQRKFRQGAGRSAEVAAKIVGVSERQVAAAKSVLDKAPDLAEKVTAGEITVHAATQEMKRREEPEEKPEPVKDEIGGEVPERLAGMFTDIRFDELAGQLRAVKKGIKALTDDPLGVWLHAQDVLASLENVIKAVKFARPHALCPYCKGGGNKGCKTCRKSGWMPVEVYNAVPEADR